MKLSNPEIHNINNEINTLESVKAAEDMKMPSMKVYDPVAVQKDIDVLKGKLKLHNDAMAEETAAKQKALQDSKKILDKTLADLKKTADYLDKQWPKLHHTHRGRIAEIKNTLRQVLR